MTLFCIMKLETIVIDNPSLSCVSSIMIVSDDATIWSISYDHHYDDHKSFIIQATDQSEALHGAPHKNLS
jgi:hypothetical protein